MPRHNSVTAHSSPRLLQVGNFLSRRGYTLQFVEELSDRLEREGWSVVRASDRVNKAVRLASIARRIIAGKNTFDIAHVTAYSGSAFLWAETAVVCLKMLRKPFVLSLHGGNLPSFASRWPRRVQHLLQSADAVVAPSRFMQHAMRRFRNDIKIIPNPVDASRFGYRFRQHAAPRLIWLRSFHAIYNPALAPRVLALLVNDFPDLKLMMAGPDKGDGSFQRVKETAQKLGVERNIVFPGRVDNGEVPRLLNDADIFINTTNVDNTPISILEAMACGLCVVTTNVGGIPSFCNDGENALSVPPDDEVAMAAAIRRILSENGIAAALSRNARTSVEQHDWNAVLPRWKFLFQSIFSKTPADIEPL